MCWYLGFADYTVLKGGNGYVNEYITQLVVFLEMPCTKLYEIEAGTREIGRMVIGFSSISKSKRYSLQIKVNYINSH